VLIGIGIDILQVERLRRSLSRFGKGYLDEVFSENELSRARIPAHLSEAAFYARGFCAKEACAKALGTGIDENVDWYDIAVDLYATAPVITLMGGAAERLASLTPARAVTKISLDVGTRGGLAFAFVAISV
jgi:holo-[acyl-carrier protein] synthase